MNDWQQMTLGEVAEIIPGYAFKGKHFGDTGEYVVKMKDITPSYVNLENAAKVDISNYNIAALDKYRLKKSNDCSNDRYNDRKMSKFMGDKMVYVSQSAAKIISKKFAVLTLRTKRQR